MKDEKPWRSYDSVVLEVGSGVFPFKASKVGH